MMGGMYHNGKSEHQATVHAWRAATESLQAFDRNDHPDITDRFGRVWAWHHGDTFIHDGTILCPENLVMSPSMQLQSRKLKGNPNYAGLCEICTSEW